MQLVFCSAPNIRKFISNNDNYGDGYLKIGNAYKNKGGFFEYFKLDNNTSHLNCFAYALKSYEKLLEKKSEQSINKIFDLVRLSIDSILYKYFTPIKDKPEDGDLVVYKTTKKEEMPKGETSIKKGENTHAGIYRKVSLNGDLFEVVESKWGWFLNPYGFRHDMFFAPSFYGDSITIYRLND